MTRPHRPLFSILRDALVVAVITVLALTGWMAVMRLVRADVQQVRVMPYVEGAQALGVPPQRLLFRHVLPNALGSAGVAITLGVGNAMLLVINLPLVGLWVRLLAIPYSLLFPCIIIICAIGAFSVNNSVFDVAMVGLFAILGYAFMKIGCEVPPLAIAFVCRRCNDQLLRVVDPKLLRHIRIDG